MEKKKIKVRSLLCICAAFAWWGLLYPELAMTPDTYNVIYEEGEPQGQEDNASQDLTEWDFDSNLYMEVLEAGRSRIRFRSRLLTELGAFLGSRNEDGNE